MLRLIRINAWWNTIVPQVLGWIYLSVITGEIIDQRYHLEGHYYYLGIAVVWFFVALIGVAAFGYLFNDLCDVETDARAGKQNRLAQLQFPLRILLVVVPLGIGIFGWYKLNCIYQEGMGKPRILFVAQIVALVLYSLKPFRMKERALWGVAFDAFYGHLNPVLITIFTFQLDPPWGDWYACFLGVLTMLCFIKGMRNILLHQIEDRKQDSSAQINTAVTKYGPWLIINYINDYLFPAEMFFLLCLTILLAYRIPPFIIPLILFAIVSYLKLSGWKVGYADRRLLEFKFTYFMNDYYEGWFPVFTLVVLSVYRHEFVFLLILHLLFFPRFIMNLVKDIKKIRENFKTEEDY